MTKKEANHSQGYEVGFCVLLKDENGQKCGVLYADAASIKIITEKSKIDERRSEIEGLIAGIEKDNAKVLSALSNSVKCVYETVAPSAAFVNIHE